MHTTKWIAWQNTTSTYRALYTIASLKQGNLKSYAKYYYYYGMTWFESIFKIGILPDVINYAVTKNNTDSSYIGKQKNGFYPYDYEEYHLFMEYKWQDTMLLESRKVYESDKWKRDSLTASITKSYNDYKETDKPNSAMVQLCMDAYKKCAKKGIQVYFMLPPRARTNYSILLPIFNAMPANTKIEFADPRKYPKYYDVQYGYNFHHLNYKGAKILSTDFGNLLVQTIQKDSL